MKEVVCLKEAGGVFGSDIGDGNPSLNVIVERASDTRAKMNKRVQKSVRIMTKSKCLTDELNLKYIDQQLQRTAVTRAVKKLGSISGVLVAIAIRLRV